MLLKPKLFDVNLSLHKCEFNKIFQVNSLNVQKMDPTEIALLLTDVRLVSLLFMILLSPVLPLSLSIQV